MASLELHEAISNQDQEKLKQLLQSPDLSINVRDSSGATPLYAVASHDNPAMVKMLLDAGAHVNAKNRKSWTPLHVAAQKNNMDVANALLEAGASVKRQTCRRMTPFMVACNHENVSIAKLLVEHGSPIDGHSIYDRTPLHWAIKSKDRELVQRLVEKGADVEARDSWLKAPIFEAVRCNSPDIVEYLLLHGAKNISVPDRYQRQPFHYAAMKGHLKCLEVLLKKGVDIDAKLRNGSTALMLSSAEGQVKSVKWLLEHGADANLVDKSMSTALHRVLIERQGRRNDPSHIVPWAGTMFAVLQANPDIDAETSRVVFWDGKVKEPISPLEIATKGNFKDLAQILCHAGAEPGRITRYFGVAANDLPKAFDNHTDTLEWVEEFYSSPRSLKLLCRANIRKLLGTKCRAETLDMLKVPHAIKSYLLLHDLIDDVTRHDDIIIAAKDGDVEQDLSSEAEYEPSDYDSDLYGQSSPVDTDEEEGNTKA